jgi:hypothetical protein
MWIPSALQATSTVFQRSKWTPLHVDISILDQFTQGLLNRKGNLVGHISAQQFLEL